MLRQELPKHREAIADMSEYSINSGRNSIEKQYKRIVIERDALKKELIDYERRLCNLKNDTRSLNTLRIERIKLTDNLAAIRKRLQEIKPIMTKLHEELYENDKVILIKILDTLNDIKRILIEQSK